MVLKRVFEVRTTSIYDGEIQSKEFGRGELKTLMDPGKVQLDELDGLRASPAVTCVKTHDGPLSNDPAIYIVRDGRAAIVSYFHFRNDIENIKTDMDKLIRGQVWPGSWSQHFRSWNPKSRPNTLVLRYEDLVDRFDVACNQLAQFLDVEQKAKFDVDFSRLHGLHPSFFRRGRNAEALLEIEPHLDLFNEYHSDTMTELGYYS